MHPLPSSGESHVYETEQLCTTAEADNGIEGFTSCFAGHEDLNSLCQKTQLNSSVFSELLMPYNPRFEVQHLLFKLLLTVVY